jgi:hypothetical protein
LPSAQGREAQTKPRSQRQRVYGTSANSSHRRELGVATPPGYRVAAREPELAIELATDWEPSSDYCIPVGDTSNACLPTRSAPVQSASRGPISTRSIGISMSIHRRECTISSCIGLQNLPTYVWIIIIPQRRYKYDDEAAAREREVRALHDGVGILAESCRKERARPKNICLARQD